MKMPETARYTALVTKNSKWAATDNCIVVMGSLTFFFANFRSDAIVFVVPAEIFLVRLRSTCYGILAAFSKASAIMGGFGFLYAA